MMHHDGDDPSTDRGGAVAVLARRYRADPAMTQPWPVENVTAIREDAGMGLTLRQCSLKRGFHEGTISKHAKLNGIAFPISPHRALTYDELSSDEKKDVQVTARWEKRARENLAREIALAKAEAPFARPYKGHPDDY